MDLPSSLPARFGPHDAVPALATTDLPACPGHWEEWRDGPGLPVRLRAPWRRWVEGMQSAPSAADPGFAPGPGWTSAALVAPDPEPVAPAPDVGGGDALPSPPPARSAPPAEGLQAFPLLISAADWAGLEAGLRQRARLLTLLLDDVYGAQHALHQGLLPPALVLSHPAYLPQLQGLPVQSGGSLRLLAFDLAHGPGGHWWVVAQHSRLPLGLGTLAAQRQASTRRFAAACAGLQVRPLDAAWQALRSGVQGAAMPTGAGAGVLLAPPSAQGDSAELTSLAQVLGLQRVQGQDLLVRDQRLYLRDGAGLSPVSTLLHGVDDLALDPLELPGPSHLGVAGVLQLMRQGGLRVAQRPGAAVLTSRGLLGFLPALARALLGQELLLPSLPSWWCGEAAALRDALPALAHSAVWPSDPTEAEGPAGAPPTPPPWSPAQDSGWTGRLQNDGAAYTVQTRMALSQVPFPQGPFAQAPLEQHPGAPPAVPGGLQTASVLLRIFAVADARGAWHVLPGGQARLAAPGLDSANFAHHPTLASADVWVVDAPESPFTGPV